MKYADISARNIRLFAESQNISIAQLADSIGVPQTTLNTGLKSKKGLSIEMLISIADYFGVDVETLCGKKSTFSEKKPPDPDEPETGGGESMLNFNIGKTLKSFREKKSLSIEEVSKFLINKGLKGAPKTIYGWERGHSEPDAITLMTLCDLYGISDIMEAFGYKKKSSTPDKSEAKDTVDYTEYELFYDFLKSRGITDIDNISDAQKNALVGIMQIIDYVFPVSQSNNDISFKTG